MATQPSTLTATAVPVPAATPNLPGPNPVLARELRVALRNERAFALMAFYVAILGAIVASQFPSNTAVPMESLRGMAENGATLGQNLFQTFYWAQAFLVVTLLPALAAGAISQERERQTLEPLLMSPLTPLQIVWGKAAGVLAFAALLLLSTLPLTSLCFLLGGVPPGEVIAAYAVLLGLAAFVTGFGVYCSARWATGTKATVMCYVLLPFILSLLAMFLAPGSIVAGLFLLVAGFYTVVQMWRNAEKTRLARRLGRFWWWLLYPIMALLLGLVLAVMGTSYGLGIFWIVFVAPYLLFTAHLALQRAAQEIAKKPEPRLPTEHRIAEIKSEWQRAMAPPPATYLPAPTGPYTYTPQIEPAVPAKPLPATYGVRPFLSDKLNPVFAKDLRTGLLGKFSYLLRFSYIITIGTEVLLLAWLMLDPTAWIVHGTSMFATWATLHLALLMMAGALFGSRALAPEREQQTLPQLLTTPLTPSEIVQGKMMAVGVYTGYVFVMGLPLAGLLVMLGILPIRMALVFLLLEVVFAALAAAWGIYCSLSFSTVRRALGWALGGMMALLMTDYMLGSMSALQGLPGVDPFERVALFLANTILPFTAMTRALVVPQSAFSPSSVAPPSVSWIIPLVICGAITIGLLLWTQASFKRYAQTV